MFRAVKQPGVGLTPPLTEDQGHLVKAACDGAEMYFKKDGTVKGVLMYLKEDTVKVTPLPDLSPEIKDQVAFVIGALRAEFECVVMVSEVWISHHPTPESLHDKTPAEIEALAEAMPAPSQDPNRGEGIMVSVYVKDRTIAYFAAVTRNPDQMGPWSLMSDSAEKSEDLAQAVGRFV